ncbi:MAG: PDZ domain-containing protein, partial [Candidatus Kerfeldbacteria bacterium]|nr:PDZ domain-containing protein [Candidatus Kerfeldbacteria bacterium]
QPSTWTGGPLQQPRRTPWGLIILLSMIIALAIDVGLWFGVGWFVRNYPQNWLTRWLPATSTTTIVQTPNERTVTIAAPAAVTTVSASSLAIHQSRGQGGTYPDVASSGVSWALSSSGWSVTVAGALPSDAGQLIVLSDPGQPQAVVSTVKDPATPFVFLKTAELSVQPISLAPASDNLLNASVWVVGHSVSVLRQVTAHGGTDWSSSDHQGDWWQLDTPVAVPAGSLVTDTEGRAIGLLDSQSRLWTLDTITPILRQLIQQSTIERPALRANGLWREQAVVEGLTSATGLLIGAPAGQAAVEPKGPADKAGLRAGDVIISVNGEEIRSDFFRTVAAYRPGEKVTVVVQRGQQQKTLTVTFGSLTP